MGMERPPRRDEEEDVDEDDDEEEGDATALVTIVRLLLPEEEEAAEPEAIRLWGIARERCMARKRDGLRGIQLERLRDREGRER